MALIEGVWTCPSRILRSFAIELSRSCAQASPSLLSRSVSASVPAVCANWVRQDRIDHGEISGIKTAENSELKSAHKRIRELEREVEILRVAAKLLGEDKPHPKGFIR